MTVSDVLMPPSKSNQRAFTPQLILLCLQLASVLQDASLSQVFKAHERHGWRSGVLRDLLFDVDQKAEQGLRRISARLRVFWRAQIDWCCRV